MLDFQENEGDSRTLKKVEEPVQHFREQCKQYGLKQNITYEHWWKFDEITYEKEKREEVCILYKSETNLSKMWCSFMVCRAMLEEMPYMQKRHMDEFMFLMFLSMINRYIATFCDLKERTKSYFIF